jgi:hypothetical protein
METGNYPTFWTGSLRRTIWESAFATLILAGGFPSIRETILEVPEDGAGGSDIESLTVCGKRFWEEVYYASRSSYNLTDGTPATI